MSKDNPTFYENVYAVTRRIPVGRVTTYGAIADYLQLGAPRMVGWALNRNFTNDNIPAHRVVNRKGELSGRHHFGSPTLMQEFLESEGVRVVDNVVQDFEKVFWMPEG